MLDHKITGSIYTMIKSEVFKNHAFVGGNKGLGLLNMEKPDEFVYVITGKCASPRNS